MNSFVKSGIARTMASIVDGKRTTPRILIMSSGRPVKPPTARAWVRPHSHGSFVTFR